MADIAFLKINIFILIHQGLKGSVMQFYYFSKQFCLYLKGALRMAAAEKPHVSSMGMTGYITPQE